MQHRLQHFALTFIFAFAFWLLLVGTLEPQEAVAGLLVAAVVAVLSLGRTTVFAGLRLTPAAPLAFVRYLGALLVALLRANLDMARRVLTPSLPLRPAIVRIKTTLQSDLGRLILANSITLTPGTLSIDIDGDELLVHWVDCPPDTDMQQVTEAIAGAFQRHIGGFVR